jgi:DNA-directed RNA polymerase sigma subunit (sigma70/sigma32)
MGLRQRKSLLRCQTSSGEQPQRKSSSRSSLKTSARKNRSHASIKLVIPDEQLDQFLDPSCDYEAPLSAVTTPSNPEPSRVEEAVQTLGKLECAVIAALFPPTGEPPATLEEISRDLGMTIAEVQNIADEALRGLRGVRGSAQRISKAWN